MPRELPRRVVEPKPAKLFKELKKELEGKKKINTAPPKGQPKGRGSIDPSVLDPLLERLTARQATLKGIRPRVFLANFEAVAEVWRAAARECRGDLAGFWNDVRHEVGVRARAELPHQQEVDQFNKVLDYLESADLDGGLSEWLDRWKMVATDRLSPSWEALDETTEALEQSIRYQAELLDQFTEPLSERAKELRAELAHALEAIGAEISRNLEKRRDTDEKLGPESAAIADRLMSQTLRKGVDRRLKEALAGGRLKEAFLAEFPEALRNVLGVRVAVDLLSDCQVAAGNLQELINTGPGRAIKDEIALARDLALKTDKLSSGLKQILDTTNAQGMTENTDPVALNAARYSLLSSSIGSLAEMLRDNMLRLSDQLKSPTAKAALLDSGSMVVGGPFESLITRRRMGGHVYDRAYEPTRQAFKEFNDVKKSSDLPLGTVWRQTYDYIYKHLVETARPVHDKSLAEAFKKDFGQAGLAGAMDKWGKRTPADAPTLGWALVVKLREYKATVADTLRIRPDLAEFLGYCLDAITEGVTEDVQALDKPRR
jgi:hypothetical protein